VKQTAYLAYHGKEDDAKCPQCGEISQSVKCDGGDEKCYRCEPCQTFWSYFPDAEIQLGAEEAYERASKFQNYGPAIDFGNKNDLQVDVLLGREPEIIIPASVEDQEILVDAGYQVCC